MLKKQHSSGERRHVRKDHQPSPELVTFALLQSFSHASYGIGHAHSSHIVPYVPVTGVPHPRPLKYSIYGGGWWAIELFLIMLASVAACCAVCSLSVWKAC